MKKICLLCIFTCTVAMKVYTQAKHDYVWTLGYGKIGSSPSGNQYGGVLMDFNETPSSLTPLSYVIDVPKTSVSNREGHLIAYTDGCRVLNRNHEIMLGGDTINSGVVFNMFCKNIGYPAYQGSIFLPKPDSDSLYFLFHIRRDDVSRTPMNLLYSVVDASGDAGNGRVVAKNLVAVDDSLYLSDYVTATRHANGRDWWVVSPRRNSNNKHVCLLTETGVEYKGMQDFDYLGWPVEFEYWSSQTAFSPDGSKYFHNSIRSLWVLDFDRCTGTMSNPIRLDWDSLPSAGFGVAASPNSRYLYLCSGGRVRQYDLWAPDLGASMVLVAEYDGTMAPNTAGFFQMAHGPDGKIYISTTGSNYVLHVIHQPNEPGLACQVEQRAIWLPSIHYLFMPNFPNYRLGPLEEPCDTLSVGTGAVLPPESISFRLFPNPNVGDFRVEMLGKSRGEGEVEFMLYDAMGRLVKREETDFRSGNLTQHFYYGDLPAGLYTLAIQNGEQVVFAKVVIQR